ncbi:MarR family winged helix-turn-helix transcriptional regulator [Priestia megaterium]|uniref:MarR family winged helix-turn-helix transcriptional regulator n=1 Tax=Priestia megaterium TaxID=1404 RepID=UPI00064C8516|nr:MarR family winged helix-turn-helix transcriptional regulator [Priestia megaterium]MDN4634611.1 MarR family winged helix-turn-helix transcriptional regulator [Sphingomonas sp. PsM26]KLV29324.1 regulatory protein MarR [Priestia megaterium]MCE4090845.1 MarR family winged helix-turn-helix transcriptional regulator [Priestia megaterium]MDH3160356.1 MarR family winged helix-turn-helix transcriptional regulator [Priestia megaterium]MDQ0804188.1 DNA-binding MarR family transcriptional regulator [P
MNKWNQSYGFLLGKALQQMEQKFAEGLAPFNINSRQYGVLLFIEENPYSSQKDISDNLQIDRTTMVSHIDHLEMLRFVERTKNPNDRRSYSLLITEKGKEVLNSRWEFLTDVESEVLTPLNPQERQLLKDFLIRIWKSL